MHRRSTNKNNNNTDLIRVQTPFDYGQVAASLRKPLQEESEAIRRLIVNTASNVIQIGLHLKFARRCLGRERFPAWLRAEFQWSQSVASNYMRAADVFGNVECLDRLQPSALYVLARHKATDAARADALERARNGLVITKAIAEGIVREHNGASPRPSRDALSKVSEILEAIGREVESISSPDRDRLDCQLTELLRKLQNRPPTLPE